MCAAPLCAALSARLTWLCPSLVDITSAFVVPMMLCLLMPRSAAVTSVCRPPASIYCEGQWSCTDTMDTTLTDWAPLKKQLVERVGDVENDDEMNRKISPYYHADKIK